jgi:hypothetical protein
MNGVIYQPATISIVEKIARSRIIKEFLTRIGGGATESEGGRG